MIYSAGDLGIEIDLGANEPGAVLQRKEPGGWQSFLVCRINIPLSTRKQSFTNGRF